MELIDSSRRIDLIKDTVYCFISPEAEVLGIENIPMNPGCRAVELMRNRVRLQYGTGTKGSSEQEEIYLVTKQATFAERSALSRLFSQGAKVPFSLSGQPLYEGRSLLCIEDVDGRTDYSRLDMSALQQKETEALAYIHYVNLGCICDLPWLPRVDEAYLAEVINTSWRISWEHARQNAAFTDTFGRETLSAIEEIAGRIVEDMMPVVCAAHTFTMIHNDLNPGNVLVKDNRDVYFIDWEEARYGSLFMDIPMRCGTLQQAEEYRRYLGVLGCDIPQQEFAGLFRTASRYLGLRFMCWNLGVWQENGQARADLVKYMRMVTDPLYSGQGF
ncbi:phosphotransferase [Paenibacillus camerounensis]|uniref:phosphotransferase n=1 Tax=Paenibacillus camerounensis TaxID=1243663 RepID=UPI0005AA6FE4|nr:phosphotransferase [Paenibacillus camerounensis]